MRTIGILRLLGLAIPLGVTAASATASPRWEQCANGGAGTKYESGQCLKASSAGEWAWQEKVAWKRSSSPESP